MALPYQYVNANGSPVSILRRADNASIPLAPANADYQKWLADGGAAVTDPADPPPVTKCLYRLVWVEDFRTTDAVQATMVAWPLAGLTLYAARFTIMAHDTVNGDCRVWHATATAKRLNAGALMVGVPTIVSSHADAGAASWVLAADVSGNNFRVRVTGAAGRTISWSLLGEVARARPDGLVD